MARRPDYHECHTYRRNLVQLVRLDVQMRRLPGQGLLLCQRSRRQIQAVPRLLRPEGTEESRGADPAPDLGELLLRSGVPTRLRPRNRAADRGDEMAGWVPKIPHVGPPLPVGRHPAEGNRSRGKMNT